jgi:hypothetical protein
MANLIVKNVPEHIVKALKKGLGGTARAPRQSIERFCRKRY